MVRRRSADEVSRQLPLPQSAFQILVALADQDRHGYAIMQDVAVRTGGSLKLSPGTLYGSIKRMLEDGLIVEINVGRVRTRTTSGAGTYRITQFGRDLAQAEADRLTVLLRQARAVGLTSKRA